MTSLRQKLIEYIRIHGQVYFRDIEKYAEENGYKAYTAVRRLQEVRDPKDLKHYDPDIHIIDEDGKIDGDGTIKWYIYKPSLPEGKKFNAGEFIAKVEKVRAVLLKNDPDRFNEDIIPPAEQRTAQEKTPRINDSVPSQPISRGYAYSRTEPEVCCQIFKVSGFTHSQGCETQKVTNT